MRPLDGWGASDQLPAASTKASDAGCGWFKPSPSGEAPLSWLSSGSSWWVEGATRHRNTMFDAHQPCTQSG